MYRSEKESSSSDTKRSNETARVIPKITTGIEKGGLWTRCKQPVYPFSKVLRLRVLQVVCGIIVTIMGSVACIEERALLNNLGMGVFAGIMTVVASACCIHTSRGFAGYRQPSWEGDSILRFLGPTVRLAILMSSAWILASFLNFTLLLRSLLTLIRQNSSNTSFLLAIVQGSLSATVLLSVFWIAKVDCTHDPD